VRGPGSIFRIGGEEFLVVLPDAGGAGPAVVLDASLDDELT